jgi:hypothetical protein
MRRKIDEEVEIVGGNAKRGVAFRHAGEQREVIAGAAEAPCPLVVVEG